MGDVADMMLDGTLCEGCGVYLKGEAPGYPRYCGSCKDTNPPETDKIKCPHCHKHVKPSGLKQHIEAKHG